MLGMSFATYLVLLVIAVVVAAVFHFVLRYRFLEGIDSFIGKIIVGWIGAWLGSPVVGHWLFEIQEVYIIPAIIGAAVAVFVTVLCLKALAKACAPPPPV